MNNELKNLWNILRITFGIVPIVAGLDKFTNLLVQWDKYLSPQLQSMLPFSSRIFMSVVGVIEIAAGLILLKFTKLGSYIVMAWLVSIALVLITGGMYDVAVRDIVMAITAFVLAKLTDLKEQTA
ncbi:MAG: hypothetical protein PHP42_10235 [Bacteroidota bacterium]|nr:hypothetical protein [Bacteroidota bacterium]